MKFKPLALSLIGSFCFAYSFLRAWKLSITHDEASSYHGFISKSFENILYCKPATANNHLLNSLLSKLSVLSFGLSELTLRLPNLLAHLLFIYFGYKVIQYLSKDFRLQLLFFILINFNPYVIEFFSLARGYGLALGLMMASIYYALHYLENSQTKNWTFSLIFAGLAVYSNFVLLNYYVSLLAVMTLLCFVDHYCLQQISFKKTISKLTVLYQPVLGVSLVLTGLTFGVLKKLILSNSLYYGGIAGFFTDTFRSLVNNSLFFSMNGQVRYLAFITQGIVIITILTFCYMAFRSKLMDKKSLLLPLILLFCFLSNVTQFHWLGTKYALSRTSIYYFPLLILTFLSFFKLVDGLSQASWSVFAKWFYTLLIGSLWLCNFGLRANLQYSWEWKYDQDTKKVIEFLQDYTKSVPTAQPFSLGAYWIYVPSMHFYLKQNTASNLMQPPFERQFNEEGNYDFYYVKHRQVETLAKDYERIKQFKSGVLLKRVKG